VRSGDLRVDLRQVPGPIAGMFLAANQTLRDQWTLSERLREIVRLYSAFENDCHT
jgi:hypothetical protein